MDFEERITVHGKNVTIKREGSPVNVKVVDGQGFFPLQKLNVNNPELVPSNFDKADGTPMTLFQCEDGTRLDLSKRSKEEMPFWHRSTDFDELIFCYKGSIIWETELGEIKLESGEMFVIPRGIAHRSKPGNDSAQNIILEIKLSSKVSPVTRAE
jgi:homogentisate 1,2-dioxygenase